MFIHRPALAALVATFALACSSSEEKASADGGGRPCAPSAPSGAECGAGAAFPDTLIPASDPLASKALAFERQFHAFNAFGHGLNADVVATSDQAGRAAIASFVAGDSWDFEGSTGTPVTDVIDTWQKVAGLYGGAGVAVDAMRYAVLRDAGADCGEVDVAREFLRADLDELHRATAITGTPGVIARGYVNTAYAPDGAYVPEPLFDSNGEPLPEEKDNGTWRRDQSGEYPGWIWEDSCSRDMMVGWALAYATVWEVIRDDPDFSDEKKQRLQADAAAIARSLMRVGEDGYDLEIRDADGRVTYHGYLHEDAIDRVYIPGTGSGFQGIMALGIVGGFAFVAEDEEIDAYLYEQLIDERGLHTMARDNMLFVDTGVKSNYSSYNMAFTAGWIAHRYVCHDEARSALREAVATSLYDRPERDRQPADDQGQSLYDMVYVATTAGATTTTPASGAMLDGAALERGLVPLREYPEPPFFEAMRTNCDETEIESGTCIAEDGTELTLLGYEGRGDTLVSVEPVPMRIRPHSNYYWRSNPYQVNGGGDGSRLLPATDFRLAYWLGRFVRRE